jgi:AmmeMemoRadiSam system protein A
LPDLSAAATAVLLDFACEVVMAAVRHAPPPPAPADDDLQERRGVFVSLHSRGHLRGCLGHVEADLPLAVATCMMAEAVTAQDPRFAPVRPDELDGLDVEVSVLSPLRPIAPDEVVPGRDGLMIRRGRRAGLLLPQVATECGMDRPAFLEALCHKAMLAPGSWRDPASELLGFTVQRVATRIRA